MHIFRGRYFNINRRYLSFVGLWPYDTKTKTLRRTVCLIALSALSLPHLASIIIHYKDIDRWMLSVISFCTLLICIIKMTGSIKAEDSMKILYEGIAANWRTIEDENEREILYRYSERARLFCICWTVLELTCMTIGLLPMLPKFLDKMDPLEEARPSMYVLQGEFFIDREAHFVEVYIIDVVTIALMIAVVLTIDSMYVVSSQHNCALYAIISYRLRKLKRMIQQMRDSNPLSMANGDGDSYDWMISTIKLHQTALTFTSTMNHSYSLVFLFVLPLYIFLIPFSACAVLATLHNTLHLLPYAAYVIASTILLLVHSWPGQTIIDHSFNLCDDAYCNEWYTTPLRTRKLLGIFMMRCSQPAAISAGGLFLLNLVTFSFIMRTAISYITVAASFR